MSAEMNYPPGTVAVATVRGVPNVRVFRVGSPVPWWASAESLTVLGGAQNAHPDHVVTDIRAVPEGVTA